MSGQSSYTPMNPQHALYTPYPRFITLALIESLRNTAQPIQPLYNTTEEISPHYFEKEFHVVASLGEGEFSLAYRVVGKSDGGMYAVKRSRKAFLGHKDRYAYYLVLLIEGFRSLKRLR